MTESSIVIPTRKFERKMIVRRRIGIRDEKVEMSGREVKREGRGGKGRETWILSLEREEMRDQRRSFPSTEYSGFCFKDFGVLVLILFISLDPISLILGSLQ